MKQRTILFLMTIIPFLAFSQFATMTMSEPIKAISGRTHKVSMYTDEKGNIILQPYLPKFFCGLQRQL